MSFEEEVIDRLVVHNVEWAYPALLAGKAVRRFADDGSPVWKMHKGIFCIWLPDGWTQSAHKIIEEWRLNQPRDVIFEIVEVCWAEHE